MFDIHLGDNLRIPSDKFKEGFYITGNPGQGKTVSLINIALEAIKNNQTGLLLDPYGDLARDVKNHLISTKAKNQVFITSLEVNQKDLNTALDKGLFVIASGNFFEDGNRATAKKGIDLLNKFFIQAKKDQWLIADEAFSLLTDDLFEKYLEFKKIGLYPVFSANDFLLLSKKERKLFAKAVKNIVIYKPRRMNAILMSDERDELNPEDINAIKQYHFQVLMNNKISNHRGRFPLDDI